MASSISSCHIPSFGVLGYLRVTAVPEHVLKENKDVWTVEKVFIRCGKGVVDSSINQRKHTRNVRLP